MANYYFETLAPSGGRYLYDNKWTTIKRNAVLQFDNTGILVFSDDGHLLTINIPSDTVYIDNVSQGSNGKTVQANLYALFPDANTGSGGSGAVAVEEAAYTAYKNLHRKYCIRKDA